MEKIDYSRLVEMLSDPNVPDSEIRPYLQIDPSESAAFRPVIVPNPALVEAPKTESAGLLSSLNSVARWRRHQIYDLKIRDWHGLKVVSEGDSWFEYPFLIEDVIDHLFHDWAIYDLSAAGDLLSDMVREDEVVAAVQSQKPDFVLLSGGGNDVLGGGHLSQYLSSPRPGMHPEDYVKPEFDTILQSTIENYARMIGKAVKAGVARVVVHTYDYPIPNNGRWLGRPMQSIGIDDRQLQREILHVLIDRFHDGLMSLVQRFDDRVVLADCRGLVPDDEWYDELHPTSRGFAPVAAKIAEAAAPGFAIHEFAALETIAQERIIPFADTTVIEALLAVDSDDLLGEIGRRQMIIDISPEAGPMTSLEMPTAMTESFLGDFRELGQRIVARLHRELFDLLCSTRGGANEERDKLRNALKLSQAGMIGAISAALISLGAPALIAPLVAAVIVKSGIDPTWEVTCQYWGEKVGKDTCR